MRWASASVRSGRTRMYFGSRSGFTGVFEKIFMT